MVFFSFCLVFGTKADLASEHKPVVCFPLPSLWENSLNTEMLEAAVAGMLVNLPGHLGGCAHSNPHALHVSKGLLTWAWACPFDGGGINKMRHLMRWLVLCVNWSHQRKERLLRRRLLEIQL